MIRVVCHEMCLTLCSTRYTRTGAAAAAAIGSRDGAGGVGVAGKDGGLLEHAMAIGTDGGDDYMAVGNMMLTRLAMMRCAR